MVTNTLTSHFKFPWKKNKARLKKSDYPVNELNKKPGQFDQIHIKDLANEFLNSPKGQSLKEAIKKHNTTRPQKFSECPTMAKIAIKRLFSALMVQRRIDFDHVMKIVLNWDSRRPMTVNVIKYTPNGKYYITDGQHTVLAYAIRAFLGMFSDVSPDKWLDLKINCQVVETDDFSFAREHFLGINGDDKLPLNPFDYWKNDVLGKRQDSPNKNTHEHYEWAFSIQNVLETNNIYPVDQDTPDRVKSGALSNVNLLYKIKNIEDIKFVANNHKTYWPHEPVDPMEMLPLIELRQRLLKNGADLDSVEFEEFMRDINAIIKEVAGGFAEFKNLTQQVFPEYHEAAFGEPKNPPADASLVLLLKMYKKAGGTYKFVPDTFVKKYSEMGTDLFDHLSPAKRKLFK